MKKLLFWSAFGLFFALSSITASAAADGKSSMPDPRQAGSQYLAYPRPAYGQPGMPELTPAPTGFVPFHIEHYGRHGSRWLLKDDDYSKPVKYLRKASEAGKLTPRGEQLLTQLEAINNASKNRVGELTPLGHRQHRDIAHRMMDNFPQIFVPGTHVDAKSTVVIRCILSMANEIAEMQRLCPGLTVSMDASRTTQKILSYNSTDTVAKKLAKKAEKLSDKFEDDHIVYDSFVAKVYNDPKFAIDSLKAKKLFRGVFDIAVNTQSHDDQPDLYDLFTPEELNSVWMANNAWWYTYSANTSLTKNRVPYNQRVLMRNIIESADTAMVSSRQSVNLRFGHESIVLPLAILMGLNDSDLDLDNLEEVASRWRNYEIFPMGSNIQMIFYRPESNPAADGSDVLVKVLLNEDEARIPALKPVSGPYYSWKDLRAHYMDKLDSFSTRFSE